ncbi:MAG: LuxR C-terminal-related transcriptional regulator [Rhodobiaceae bacterium]|nr:regulatory protein SdiA [Rhodobiaceae bacterium]MCR9240225.1 LuxR C-terminal-related transcriptional regulator [Rhodobiaceae bacterium]
MLNHTFSEALDQAGSVDAIAALFLAEIQSLGYEGYDAYSVNATTLHKPRQAGNWVVASYGVDNVMGYIVQGLIPLCPVFAQAGTRATPFNYLDLLREHVGNPAAAWQLELLEAERITGAWWIPINAIGASKGVTVYLKGDAERVEVIAQATRDEVHLKSVYFFQALEKAGPTLPDGGDIYVDPLSTLSERERECLNWAAQGKTNLEIGLILGISANTVSFHFKNIFRRLEVHSRTQAVAAFTRTVET